MARVSLSEVSTGDWSLKQDVETFARLGADGIGVLLPKLEAHGVEAGIRLIRDAGLGVSYLMPRTNIPLTDPAGQAQAVGRLKQAIEVAARLEAACMFVLAGTDYALSWEESAARFRTGLAEILPVAERHNVRLAIEPVMTVRCDLSFLHSEWDAAAIAAELGSPNVGVVAEIQVLWRERGIEQFVRENRDRIFNFQLSDFMAGTYCASQRAVVGDGVIPLARILRAFRAAGYRGWYDVELLGTRIAEEGYASALGRSLGRLRALLAEAV